ncbi:CheY-like chemotaxis protein [Mycetocola sp. CAN_C7]|uniref:response regulator transcription factor n=1 Tax=Mycetocola sp. CAN_C7 TaxID=2787724 RepID=UPI001A35B1EE
MTSPTRLPRVVIADDDADMRMLVGIAVRKAGCELAAVASDGEEAWRAITEQHPDLIVLDVSMPGMSGLEVCRLVKNDPTLSDIPVLLLSAGVSGPSRDAGVAAGADDFMPKPFSPRLLAEKIITLSAGRNRAE